jgi:hypothetical protein
MSLIGIKTQNVLEMVDFEGIIPKGTPMMQVLPFKRESWVSEESEKLAEDSRKEAIVSKRVFTEYYKSTWWKNKTYE